MKKIGAALLMLFCFSAFADDDEDFMPKEAYSEYQESDEISSLEPAVQPMTTATATVQAPTPTQAENALSSACIKSASHLYRFYFHEIYPNPKNEACKNQSATLGEKEAAEMQAVIAGLKKECPTSFVTQVIASFRELKTDKEA